jgi:signal transduction histidine kinase
MVLKQWFSAPAFPADEEKTRKALFLHIILMAGFFLLAGLVILRSLMNPSRALPSIILSALLILSVLLFIILHRGHVFLTSLIFVTAAWSGMTIVAIFSDGIRDVAVIVNIIIILVGTLLLGQRTAVIFTLLSIASVWVLAYLEKKEFIHPFLDKTINLARDFTAIYILVAVLTYLIERSQQMALTRIKKELQEKIRAENNLRENEKRLQEKNEELKIAVRKAKENDRLKTAFLQNLSHEIRTPMNAIVGFSELLKKPGISRNELTSYTDVILNSSRQLLSTITDILTISAIQSGLETVTETRVNINTLLVETKTKFDQQLKGKNIDFSVVPALHNNEAVVLTDETKLGQILTHLIDNAVKFTESGRIEAGYTLGKKMIWFYVKDTGIGIDPLMHKKIFDPFFQADETTSIRYGGEGLGLAISKAHARLLGGSIKVQSKPGEGAVFSFSIPYIPAFNETEKRKKSQ